MASALNVLFWFLLGEVVIWKGVEGEEDVWVLDLRWVGLLAGVRAARGIRHGSISYL